MRSHHNLHDKLMMPCCSADVVKALLYNASTIELSLSAATAAAAAAAAVLQRVNLYFTAAVRGIAERRYGSSSCERCPDETDVLIAAATCQCQRHVPFACAQRDYLSSSKESPASDVCPLIGAIPHSAGDGGSNIT
jgi:hypothetical protein